MMITLSVLYYLYLVVVAIFILYSLFNIYHLIRFGFLSWVNVLIIFLYILAAGIILAFSFDLLVQIDWHQPLFDSSNFNQPF